MFEVDDFLNILDAELLIFTEIFATFLYHSDGLNMQIVHLL